MSFEDGGNSKMPSTGSIRECQPDYEAQAKNQKKKFDSTTDLKATLMSFIELNDTYRFRDISSLAELLGGLVITETEQEKIYEHLLVMVEQNK